MDLTGDIPSEMTLRDLDFLITALRAPATSDELVGESAAVAAFMAADAPADVRAARPVLARRHRLRLAVAAAVGGLSLTTGLAAAGALPGAAQQVASDTLSHVGIDVPNPNDHAGDHPGSRGQSGEDHGKATAEANEHGPDTTTHGAEVSNTAKTTDATGADKGAEISTVASDGRSQAGADEHGKPADAGKPAETPATPDAASHADGHKP
jgi:hypothetical protein